MKHIKKHWRRLSVGHADELFRLYVENRITKEAYERGLENIEIVSHLHVGQRVRMIQGGGYDGIVAEYEEGTIMVINPASYESIGVKWDDVEDGDGHDLESILEDETGWYVTAETIAVIESEVT